MGWDARRNVQASLRSSAKKRTAQKRTGDDVNSVGRNYNRKRKVKIGTAVKITRKRK